MYNVVIIMVNTTIYIYVSYKTCPWGPGQLARPSRQPPEARCTTACGLLVGAHWPGSGAAESKAVDCTFAIMTQARMDGTWADQLTLPLCHGGFGLAHNGPEEGDAAYLSAVATTQLAMRHRPTEFRPLDVPNSAQLCLKWEAFHGKANTLWRLEIQVVSQDSIGTIAKEQHAYCRHLAQARAHAFLASLHGGTEDGKRART
jgi:hypothetical protein